MISLRGALRAVGVRAAGEALEVRPALLRETDLAEVRLGSPKLLLAFRIVLHEVPKILERVSCRHSGGALVMRLADDERNLTARLASSSSVSALLRRSFD